uniref:Uncharacterized protein n=1 Tax=Molossus molossus TaxID=27622 RepID=A0A7J8F998_MOLMO|nr:hypothetical protein HJG59_008466 [Molossus molossus]
MLPSEGVHWAEAAGGLQVFSCPQGGGTWRVAGFMESLMGKDRASPPCNILRSPAVPTKPHSAFREAPCSDVRHCKDWRPPGSTWKSPAAPREAPAPMGSSGQRGDSPQRTWRPRTAPCEAGLAPASAQHSTVGTRCRPKEPSRAPRRARARPAEPCGLTLEPSPVPGAPPSTPKP